MKPSPSTVAAFYGTLARGLDELERSLAASSAAAEFVSAASLRAALALIRAAHAGHTRNCRERWRGALERSQMRR